MRKLASFKVDGIRGTLEHVPGYFLGVYWHTAAIHLTETGKGAGFSTLFAEAIRKAAKEAFGLELPDLVVRQLVVAEFPEEDWSGEDTYLL